MTRVKHAGATVAGEPRHMTLTPRGLPVGVYDLRGMDPVTGEVSPPCPLKVEGWPYFTPSSDPV